MLESTPLHSLLSYSLPLLQGSKVRHYDMPPSHMTWLLSHMTWLPSHMTCLIWHVHISQIHQLIFTPNLVAIMQCSSFGLCLPLWAHATPSLGTSKWTGGYFQLPKNSEMNSYILKRYKINGDFYSIWWNDLCYDSCVDLLYFGDCGRFDSPFSVDSEHLSRGGRDQFSGGEPSGYHSCHPRGVQEIYLELFPSWKRAFE